MEIQFFVGCQDRFSYPNHPISWYAYSILFVVVCLQLDLAMVLSVFKVEFSVWTMAILLNT